MQFINDFVQNTKNAFSNLTSPVIRKIIFLIIALQVFSLLFLTPKLGLFSLIIMPIVIIAAIAHTYLTYKSVHALMHEPKKQYDVVMFLKFILMSILQGFAVLFSVFDLKWLLVLILSGVLFVCGFFAKSNVIAMFALFGVAGILLLTYFVILIRNIVRLSFVFLEYLQDPSLTFFSSFKATWNKTSGKAKSIFARLFIFGLLVSLPIYVIYFGLQAIGRLLDGLLLLPINLFTAILAGPLMAVFSLISVFYYLETFKSMFPKEAPKPITMPIEPIASKPANAAPSAKAKIVSKKNVTKK